MRKKNINHRLVGDWQWYRCSLDLDIHVLRFLVPTSIVLQMSSPWSIIDER